MIRSHIFPFVSQDLLTIVTFKVSIDKDKKNRSCYEAVKILDIKIA